MLKKAFGVDCLSDRQIFRWHQAFAAGPVGKMSTTRTALDINLHFRRQCETYITKTIVHEIVSESLGMRKVCAKLVPKMLTDDQKARRVETCQELLDTCEDNPAFLDDMRKPYLAFAPFDLVEAVTPICGDISIDLKRFLQEQVCLKFALRQEVVLKSISRATHNSASLLDLNAPFTIYWYVVTDFIIKVISLGSPQAIHHPIAAHCLIAAALVRSLQWRSCLLEIFDISDEAYIPGVSLAVPPYRYGGLGGINRRKKKQIS
ncbi:hypothetical protein NQ318_004407, partial [Aromia moschata]